MVDYCYLFLLGYYVGLIRSILLLPFLLFADFTLLYKLDNNITQELNYKDAKHVLFTFRENNRTFQKLLINKDGKFLSLNENGIENIYQIDDNISEPINENSEQLEPNYTIKRKEPTEFKGFKAEKWFIQDANSTDELTVSNDPKLTTAIKHCITALKEILPANKQQDADIFNVGRGYILLAKDNLRLLSFKESPIELSLFQIDNTLSKEDEEEFERETQKCFNSLCCGRKHYSNETISSMLNTKVDKWTLKEFAKCENIDSKSGLESALYKNSDGAIVVEMTTGDNTLYGKIDSLKEQGITVSGLKKEDINGFKAVTAYLPSVDATIVDLILPNGTFSIYQKGKKDLLPFLKKAINFSRVSNF